MTCSEDQTFNSERLATLQGDPRTKPQMVWSLDEADLFWLVIRTWAQWSGTRTLRYLWINPMVLELEPLELPWFLWCKGYGTRISGGYWVFLGASRFSLKPRGAGSARHSEVSCPPGGRPGIHIGVRGTQSQIRTLWAMLIFSKPTCSCPDSPGQQLPHPLPPLPFGGQQRTHGIERCCCQRPPRPHGPRRWYPLIVRLSGPIASSVLLAALGRELAPHEWRRAGCCCTSRHKSWCYSINNNNVNMIV